MYKSKFAFGELKLKLIHSKLSHIVDYPDILQAISYFFFPLNVHSQWAAGFKNDKKKQLYLRNESLPMVACIKYL